MLKWAIGYDYEKKTFYEIKKLCYIVLTNRLISKRGTLDGTSFINIGISGIFFYTLAVHQNHQKVL